MTLIILALLIVGIVTAVWFTVPESRQFIAGAVIAVLLFAASLLTGLADVIGGLA